MSGSEGEKSLQNADQDMEAAPPARPARPYEKPSFTEYSGIINDAFAFSTTGPQ
jgi:hypothetical protein